MAGIFSDAAFFPQFAFSLGKLMYICIRIYHHIVYILLGLFMEALIAQLKQEIIEALNLEDLTPADIENDAPLFGEGLGLDSIDALELIVLMERNYGIRLKEASEGKAIFKSVSVMAEYIAKNRTK